VYRVLDGVDGSAGARAVRAFITAVILLSVLAVIAESVPELRARWGRAFYLFEVFSVVVFSVEYLARLWAVVEDPRFRRPIAGRLRYAVSFMALVDLVAIAPFFVPHLVTIDTRVVRMLRLARLLRTLKLARASASSLAIYVRVLHTKRADLAVAVGMLVALLLVAASLVYFVEHEAQPDAFSSIPAAMWWGIITLTTIGYGDMYPVTAIGRILGGVVGVLGVAVMAVPPSIFVAGILEELQKGPPQPPATCPHCGQPLEPPRAGA
jgi:voltage-gated potassium channel